MTKQDFVNFIDGRTINFDAMYHGGWMDKTPDKWITPGTYSMAYIHINSAGKLWIVSISSKSSNNVIYGDESLDILTDTIPNDVFTAATNALAPYLITTYIAPEPAPITYIAPEPTQQKTKQDFVNFIGGRIPDYQALPQGDPTVSEPNIWKSPVSMSEAVYIYSGDGSLWHVGISCNDPYSTRCVWYGDKQSGHQVSTIPSDVFTIATNGIAPYLKNR
jgi:hypothetical protein